MAIPKLIGLMTAWGATDWIIPAMRQAAAYCDEVIICIAPHTTALEEFDDGTYDKACTMLESLPNYVKILGDFGLRGTHADVKPQILNMMLDYSELYAEGNWIWLLDVDEFYPIRSYKRIKELLINNGDIFNKLGVKEKFFYINFEHFLRGWHWRFFKIKKANMIQSQRFHAPVQRWYTPLERPLIIDEEFGMFHYSMLMNPHQKIKFWKSEYPGKTQDTKVKFMEDIYRNYNLANQDYWNEEVYKLFGIKSPWFSDSFTPDKDGRLYRYVGKHPEAVNKSWLKEVKDFRKHYEFLPQDATK